MVLPEAETQRPSFPPFANQFEEVERFRVADYFNIENAPFFHAESTDNRGPHTIRNINPPTPDFSLLPSPILPRRIDAAPSTPQEPTSGLHRPYRSPRTTPYSDEVPIILPPHLRIRIPDIPNPSHDATPTPRTPHPHTQSPHTLPNQEPTPGLHRPSRLPSTTPYPDEVSLLPPHLRITSLDMSTLSYDDIPNFRLSHPHNPRPHPLPNRPYLPTRPAPPLPSIPLSSSLSSSTPLRNLLHLPPLAVSYLPPLNVTAPPPPPPSHQLISLYALRVHPGDILAYGNRLNHGCTVTACYPDERRQDLVLRDGEGDGEGDGGDGDGDGRDGADEADVGVFGGAVKINGGIRIRWRDWRTGEELSQLFEGLEVLMVRRGEDREGDEEGG